MTHEQWSALEAVVGSINGLTRHEIGNECAEVMTSQRQTETVVNYLRTNLMIERRLSQDHHPTLRHGHEVLVPTLHGVRAVRRR